ncbi:MAG: DEAD/DEAH box helicase family protein, partial [Candidatus Helarchaeota archaeon]|nr:DEAD/DEAH box helicase family protein [Candidatus Helarchaeota archaeon]
MRLDQERSAILERIKNLRSERESYERTLSKSIFNIDTPLVTNLSPQDEKIHLFRSLFRGREDVYPRRFESLRTGKTGYQPACRNEWIEEICKKPKISCKDCENQEFLPVTDEVIRNHLLGINPDEPSKREFTIGVYPLLLDETCWFLAADFDKSSWMEDISAFFKTCRSYNVPLALERSRSGKGGHVWIFFVEPISAALARKLGSFLLTETMERRPEIGFESYDRFFPSQDTLPKGSFGNLIAQPLQKKPREKCNTVFLNENFLPYSDQWEFLSSINRMSRDKVESIVNKALLHGRVFDVKKVDTIDAEIEPWMLPPSRKRKELKITGPLPEQVKLTLNNQIYIDKSEITPFLQNQLIRIAAFQNPEFYKAQAMRLPTYNKSQIISCYEDFPKHLGIPRGCLDEVMGLLKSFNIKVKIIDKRYTGTKINVSFKSELLPDQQAAAESMLYYDTGVLSAATSFGKTVVAIYMISKRSVNTLILVHRRQLLDQWIAKLSNFLEIDQREVGQIGAGRRTPSGKIDVAIIQSLSWKGIVDDVVGDYGHLVIDECHHISARSFEIVARQSKAKYVMGLSATVIRKDGHHPIIFMNIGPIRYKVSDKKQAATRPFKHKVIVRKTEFRVNGSLDNEKSPAIHELYAALIRDESRNKMIIDGVVKSVNEKRSPIVLTERKEHLMYLAEKLSQLIRHVFVLKGGMEKKQRLSLYNKMQEIPEDEERLIIATGR